MSWGPQKTSPLLVIALFLSLVVGYNYVSSFTSIPHVVLNVSNIQLIFLKTHKKNNNSPKYHKIEKSEEIESIKET